jgi:hypothetical protein
MVAVGKLDQQLHHPQLGSSDQRLDAHYCQILFKPVAIAPPSLPGDTVAGV